MTNYKSSERIETGPNCLDFPFKLDMQQMFCVYIARRLQIPNRSTIGSKINVTPKGFRMSEKLELAAALCN